MRLPAPGKLLAAGRTSDVFEFGAGAVVKVPRPGVPAHWAEAEAAFSEAIAPLHLPAPAVRAVVQIDGRSSIVFARVDGPSMWEQMCRSPATAVELAVLLAEVQRRIHSAGIVADVPCLVRRTIRKIEAVAEISDHDRDEAVALAEGMPRGAALLHGDLHPGNVLMSPDGPMVIDWFDAAIGHPVADAVRTTILLDPGVAGEQPSHLPGGPAGLLASVREAYGDAVAPMLVDECGSAGSSGSASSDLAACWTRLVALSRLAEGVDDTAPLVSMWRQRAGSAH